MGKNKLKLAILSVALLTVTAGPAISPALATIAQAFPETNETVIKLLITLPALFIIPFIFVSSTLAKRTPKKYILLVGISLYFIGGVSGGLVSSFELLIVTRAILGIGVGLMMPISTSLVSDFFEGEERTATMGLVTAVNNLSGVILFISSGILAAIVWRAAFGVYTIALIVALLVILYLPVVRPTKQSAKAIKERLPKIIYPLSLAVFLMMVPFFSVPSNMALFIKQEGIGSSQLAGVIISIGTLAGFTSGVLLRRVRQLLGQHYVVTLLAVMAVGFTLIGFTYSITLLSVGVFMMGFSFGGILPLILDEVARRVPRSLTVQAMAMATSMLFVSQFFSPFMLDAIRYMFGQQTIRSTYQFLSISLYVATIITLIYRINKTTKQKNKLAS